MTALALWRRIVREMTGDPDATSPRLMAFIQPDHHIPAKEISLWRDMFEKLISNVIEKEIAQAATRRANKAAQKALRAARLN